MFLAVFLNLASVLLAAKKRPGVAWLALAGLGVAIAWRMASKGFGIESTALLVEGVFCSMGLVLCFANGWGVSSYYWVGALPSALFVLVAIMVPAVRDLFREGVSVSWDSQKQWMQQMSVLQTPDENASVREWLLTLFPAYWVLGTLLRIWIVRRLLLVGLRNHQPRMSRVPFIQLKLGDAFVWTFALGLLLEVVGAGSFRVIAHNVLLFCSVLYLLQGGAIIHFVFSIRRTSPLVVVAFYVLALLTQIPLVLVGLLGFLDTWMEIRNKIGKPVAQH